VEGRAALPPAGGATESDLEMPGLDATGSDIDSLGPDATGSDVEMLGGSVDILSLLGY
jgi:hypothetical protein